MSSISQAIRSLGKAGTRHHSLRFCIRTTHVLAISVPILLAVQSASGAEKVITPTAPDQGLPQQPDATPPASDRTASCPEATDTRPCGAPIVLGVSLGTLIHLSSAAHTVFVADEKVADVSVKDPNFIYVFGKQEGATVLYAQDDAGHVLLRKLIRIDGPVSIIRRADLAIGGQPGLAPTINQFQIAPTAVAVSQSPSQHQ